MSASLGTCTVGLQHITLSLLGSTMPPNKLALKQVTERSTKETIGSISSRVPILLDTQCYIENNSTVTWLTIKDVFTSTEFNEDMKYRELYETI